MRAKLVSKLGMHRGWAASEEDSWGCFLLGVDEGNAITSDVEVKAIGREERLERDTLDGLCAAQCLLHQASELGHSGSAWRQEVRARKEDGGASLTAHEAEFARDEVDVLPVVELVNLPQLGGHTMLGCEHAESGVHFHVCTLVAQPKEVIDR